MQQATSTAKNMVTRWGMSEKLGPRSYGEQQDMICLGRDIHENRDYSEQKATIIDEEIDHLISAGLATAMKIISENRVAMDKIATELLAKETIERATFLEVVGIPPANIKNAVIAV